MSTYKYVCMYPARRETSRETSRDNNRAKAGQLGPRERSPTGGYIDRLEHNEVPFVPELSIVLASVARGCREREGEKDSLSWPDSSRVFPVVSL